jgi:hypothetical protein
MKKLLNFTPNFCQILDKFRTKEKKRIPKFSWIFLSKETTKFCQKTSVAMPPIASTQRVCLREVGRVDTKEHVADVLV